MPLFCKKAAQKVTFLKKVTKKLYLNEVVQISIKIYAKNIANTLQVKFICLIFLSQKERFFLFKESRQAG